MTPGPIPRARGPRRRSACPPRARRSGETGFVSAPRRVGTVVDEHPGQMFGDIARRPTPNGRSRAVAGRHPKATLRFV